MAELLALLPLSSVAIDTYQRAGGLAHSAAHASQVEFPAAAFQQEYRTMVVIPALLGTERDAPFLLRQIEHHFLGNSDPNIFFALITDFADALAKGNAR